MHTPKTFRAGRRLALCGALATALLSSLPSFAAGRTGDPCANSRDVALVNGRIHTMDPKNTVVSAVLIQNGRIAAVGTQATQGQSACTKTIDLQGRTAVPGLIDNHVHLLRLQNLPGHDTRELETAFSMAELQARLSSKASRVPAGELISTIGGIHPNQFAERRLPVMAELDAAAPNHPVYLSVSSTGPGITNTLGRNLLVSIGVPVARNGQVASGATTDAAFVALRSRLTAEHFPRQLNDEMSYALGLGLTTVYDQAGSVPGAGLLDPATGYDPILQLARQDQVPMRIRIFFPAQDTQQGNPQLMGRLNNAFREFGGDHVRIVGLGEWLVSGDDPLSPVYEPGVRMAASRGWLYQQHTLGLTSHRNHTAVWERVNLDIPIRDLHWSLAHANNIDLDTTNRLKAMGAGVAAHGWSYLASTTANAGPPFRTLVDSGAPVGGGSDGARISTLNPWPMIYYMVTGLSSAGVMINAGQQITRDEAMRLYTASNGWFAKEEHNLGSIEVGKYGDVVVLSQDFFNPAEVPDSAIRQLKSVLTVVGGKVVHDTAGLGSR